MMESDEFKVETKPTIWWVQLSKGSYSDYTEENYFIRANSKDETWFLFKKWWQKERENSEHPSDRFYGSAIEFEDEEFLPFGKEGDENSDSCYGERWDAEITRLPLIEWKEFRKQHGN